MVFLSSNESDGRTVILNRPTGTCDRLSPLRCEQDTRNRSERENSPIWNQDNLLVNNRSGLVGPHTLAPAQRVMETPEKTVLIEKT